ncbi:MAG: hypothetical protein CMA08_02975 [Euryarchaeota archaeon]|nr:hypothetical protein [Euryarchaeota archaeon]OUX22449.1 MAG: hypothetical protein CBE12_02240 [Euryarchaeota archaeon TMED252]
MGEAWTVHKFGGSVLRGAPDLDRLADRIAEAEGPAAVVVSALWGTTDRLLRAVDDPRYAERLVSDLRSHHLMFAPRLDRGRDGNRFEHVLESMAEALRLRRANPSDDAARIQLLASGERLSALVIAHHLRRCGFAAHAVGAEDIGMVLSGVHEAAAVDLSRSAENFDRSIMHGIPVITGWLGSGNDGSLALLGRGGSDHTATAVAHLLGAHRVVLWKDVRGIHPVNPRWGIKTKPISYVSYELARMAAGLDATVLHPATVGPCIEDGIPIEVRHLSDSLKEPAPTTIGPELIADLGPMAAACTMDVCAVEAAFPPVGTPGSQQAALLTQLANRGLGVHASTSWVDGTRLIVDASAVEEIEASLNDVGMHIDHVGAPSAMITFIGAWQDPKTWLQHLGLDGIEPVDHDARKIRILVPREEAKATLERMAEQAAWLAKA